MTVQGVDFSWSRPTGAELRAVGKSFVVRYAPYPGDGGKGLTAAEVKDYQANGIAICVVWESTANRALSGNAAGVEDAGYVKSGLTALGFPVGSRPVYFAVDFNTTPANYPAILDYLNGAASVLGKQWVGVYGEAALCAWSQQQGFAWQWQTYAWSNGVVDPSAELLQYLNGQHVGNDSVDLDRALKADYGQWPAPAPKVPVPPEAYSIHIAKGVRNIQTATVVGGRIVRWNNRRWSGNASSAPCLRPQNLKAVFAGTAFVAKVTKGVFAGQYVRLANGVRAY